MEVSIEKIEVPAVLGKITQIPLVDTTLTKSGYSADAKVVGDRLDKVSAEFAKNVKYDNTNSKLDANNIQSAIDELNDDISIYNLGSFNGKTITQLQTAISNWLSNKSRKHAQCTFIANADFITLWNNKDTTTTLTSGNIYTLTVIASYTNSDYVQLVLATYYDKKLYTVVKSGGEWQELRKIAYSEGKATMLVNELISPSENAQTVSIPNYNNYDSLYITIKPDENSGVTLNIPKVMYSSISSTFHINVNNKDSNSYTARVQGYVKNGVINLYHTKLVGWTKLQIAVYGIN